MTSTVDADAGADASVTWSSSNVGVATVSATGLVSALQPGTTSIRATSVLVPAVQGSTTLTVTTPPTFTTWTQAATVVPTTAIASGAELVTLANGTAWGIASGGFDGERRMLYFDGTNWSAPAAAPFHAIRAIASFENSAWIGAFNGLFARLENVGGAPVWTSMSTPTNLNIIEMVGVSPTEAVALTLNRTLVLTGGVWTLLPASPLNGHYTMAASALDNIYTVQNTPVSGSRMRRWNGTAWTIVPDPPITGAAFTMHAFGSALLLSTTSRENFRLQNGSWTPLAVPPSGPGISNESIWSMTSCGGERYAGTLGGRVYRLDGDTWTVIATYGQAAIASGSLRVHCSPSGVLRAIGNGGSVGRYTGSNWIQEHLGGVTTAVRVSRPDLAYLTFGNAGIMRWDGSVWRVEMSDGVGTANGQRSLTGLTVASDGTAMAVGGGPQYKTGVWVRNGNGTWGFTAFTTNTVCSSVWAASSSFALAIGETCSWRYDGTNWLVQSAPLSGTRHWNTIDGFSPTFAFAAGAEGNQSIIARWDGTQWSVVTVPNIGELQEIDVVSPTLAWARSDNGLLRWNGTDWQVVAGPPLSGGQLPIAGLSVHSANEVYLLSQNYGLYRFDGTTWTLITTVSAANTDAGRAGAQALSTIPGFGIIGTGTPAPFHSTVNSGLRR